MVPPWMKDRARPPLAAGTLGSGRGGSHLPSRKQVSEFALRMGTAPFGRLELALLRKGLLTI